MLTYFKVVAMVNLMLYKFLLSFSLSVPVERENIGMVFRWIKFAISRRKIKSYKYEQLWISTVNNLHSVVVSMA